MQFSITSFGSVGEAVIFQLEGRGFDYTYSSFTRYPVALPAGTQENLKMLLRNRQYTVQLSLQFPAVAPMTC